ncbi:MAG: hypothetical protein ACI9QD_000801 [Thermoproteota archaeon]|jgi:hypothetical protein
MNDNPIKKVDELIFTQIDEMKAHTNYTKVQETIAMIEEEYKEPAKMVGTLFFLSIPLIVISMFYFSNSKIKKEIEIRKDLLKISGEILGNEKLILTAAKGAIATTGITNFSKFNNKITGVITRSRVDLSKVQVSNFKSKAIVEGIIKSEGMIKLQNITTQELATILKTLVQTNKMKIASLDFKRGRIKKLISGTMTVVHFGRESVEE